MKSIILSICILLITISSASSQGLKWSTTKNWRLYEIKNKQDYKLSVDSLSKFRTLLVNLDTIQNFVNLAEAWPKDKYSMWMGRYLCTYEIEEETRKVDISVYEGFFFDENSKTYYQIPEAFVDEWLKFWNDTYSRFH
jgi:hypothetical protein